MSVFASRLFPTPSATPSSRHVPSVCVDPHYETHSQAAFRLRLFQSLCGSCTPPPRRPDALLFIAGVDADYSPECARAILFLLLGRTGPSVLSSSTLAGHEADDTVLLVHATGLKLYCREPFLQLVRPVLAHLQGVEVFCLPEKEYMGSVDAGEDFKVAAFVEMVRGFQRIGIPLLPDASGDWGHEDVFPVEMWPLVKAFASEEFGGGGFFTMKHNVLNISALLRTIYSRCLDLHSLRHLYSDCLHMMCDQYQDFLRSLDALHVDRRVEVSEQSLAEDLLSYFEHGALRREDRSSIPPSWLPYLRFGGGPTPSTGPDTLWGDIFGMESPAPPLISLRWVDGRVPVAFSRTLFVGTGHVVKDEYTESNRFLETREEERARQIYSSETILMLSDAYAALQGAVQLVGSMIKDRGGFVLGEVPEKVVERFLCEAVTHLLRNVSSSMQWDKVVHLRVERSFGEPLPQFGPISSPLLYVEVALVGCPGCPGLDADPYLVYGDTFAIVTERPQLDSSGHGDGALCLTQKAPAFVWWQRNGLEIIAHKTVANTFQRISKGSGGTHDLLGRLLKEPVSGRVVACVSGERASYTLHGTVSMFEGGVVVEDERIGMGIVALQDLQSLTVTSFAQEENEYTMLVLEHRDMDWCLFPCLASLKTGPYLFLCAMKNTLSTREIMRQVVPVWKEFLALNDIVFSTTESLPAAILPPVIQSVAPAFSMRHDIASRPLAELPKSFHQSYGLQQALCGSPQTTTPVWTCASAAWELPSSLEGKQDWWEDLDMDLIHVVGLVGPFEGCKEEVLQRLVSFLRSEAPARLQDSSFHVISPSWHEEFLLAEQVGELEAKIRAAARLLAKDMGPKFLFVCAPAMMGAPLTHLWLSQLCRSMETEEHIPVDMRGMMSCLSAVVVSNTRSLPPSSTRLLALDEDTSSLQVKFSSLWGEYATPGFVSAIFLGSDFRSLEAHSCEDLVLQGSFVKNNSVPGLPVFSNVKIVDTEDLMTVFMGFVHPERLECATSHPSMASLRFMRRPDMSVPSTTREIHGLACAATSNEGVVVVPCVGVFDEEKLRLSLEELFMAAPPHSFTHVKGLVKVSPTSYATVEASKGRIHLHPYRPAAEMAKPLPSFGLDEHGFSLNSVLVSHADVERWGTQDRRETFVEKMQSLACNSVREEYQFLPLLEGPESLGAEELKRIKQERRMEPLPAGWFFTGINFVDSNGKYQSDHPLCEEHILEYLVAENMRRENHNSRIPSD